MASARGNEGDEPVNEYEQQRLERIARNKRMLDSLTLPNLSNDAGRTNKRAKKTHNQSAAPTGGHNLRARSQRNHARNANEQIVEDRGCESVGDFLCDNNVFQSAPQQKKRGRGITKLNDIFARGPDMPKIRIELNKHGQPVGDNTRRFSSAIGCHVRKKLSVACLDWRLVDAKKKYEVWTDIKEIYDVADAAFEWFVGTAGKKWKEFKSTLKKQYFDEKYTLEELKALYDDRVNDADWKFLINYWLSPESEEQTATAKDCRSKLLCNHTSGSKSFACSDHEMAHDLGRPPRRDELFIKTHTRKNGVPARNAGPIINKLKAIIEDRPELKERTIQQGDAFAVVCREKEPRGRVRLLGLGPTPQDVGTPGMKSYTPTRLQMEVLARKKAEHDMVALQKRIAELEEAARHRENLELVSQNGSNSQNHVSRRYEEDEEEGHYSAEVEENEVSDRLGYELGQVECTRRVASPATVQQQHQGSPVSATPSVQHQQESPTAPPPRNNDVTPSSPHDDFVGKDVILYAMLRSDLPVAKGTIICTNPNSVLGGVALGKQYCEVVVKVVLKRDTVLPRPYGDLQIMADAHRLTIAWPYKRLKVASKSSQSNAGKGRQVGRK